MHGHRNLKHGENNFLRNTGIRAAPTVVILHTLNLSSAELNPICHLLELVGTRPILHVIRLRGNQSSSIKEQESLDIIVILPPALSQQQFRVRYDTAGLSYAVCLRFL